MKTWGLRKCAAGPRFNSLVRGRPQLFSTAVRDACAEFGPRCLRRATGIEKESAQKLADEACTETIAQRTGAKNFEVATKHSQIETCAKNHTEDLAHRVIALCVMSLRRPHALVLSLVGLCVGLKHRLTRLNAFGPPAI